MSNKTISLISIFFILHGIQNILIYFTTSGNLSFIFPQEAVGGLFSIFSAYLITKKTFMANLAVLLRCFIGIFSLASARLILSGDLWNLSFTSLLSAWPLILFIVVIASFKMGQKKRESITWQIIILLFIAAMFINWIWSFTYTFEYFRNNFLK